MTANNILLVHGAWADGSAWNKVIPSLLAAGFDVTAIQMPLTTLQDDEAALRRALALVDAPVILVGHSYGGAVITEGGCDEKVVGLVYISGFAPDTGESAGSLGAGGPPTRLPEVLVPDASGFLKLSRTGVDEAFAQDLSESERALIFATQGPVSGAALGGEITSPAWKRKPCWYLRASQDHAIHPDLQTMMAARMQATVAHVEASHVSMLSEPQAAIDLILQAAR